MQSKTDLKIFLVDNDSYCLNLYEQHLKAIGYNKIFTFDSGIKCINSLEMHPDIIFLDYRMEVLDGVEVLKIIKRFDPETFVVFVACQEDLKTAVNSLKYGAFDYILKEQQDFVIIEHMLEKVHDVMALLHRKNEKSLKRA